MTKSRFRTATALLLAAAILAVGGCASGVGTGKARAAGPGAPATSTTAAAGATGSYQDQVMAWARRFAACVRSHGMPTFPDPVFPADAQPSGLQWGFTLFATVDKPTLGRAINGACADVAEEVPPAPDALQPPDATALKHMRQYAQCMRQHGLTDFPDPKADGTFPILNTPYAELSPVNTQHPSPAVAAADDACHQYSLDWQMQAS